MVRRNTTSAGFLRVLMCAESYPPAPGGGAERQARLQAEALARRGHHVTVICPRTHGLPSVARIAGVTVRRLPRPGPPRLGRATYALGLLLYLATHVPRFDLVHAHLANRPADLAVAVAKLWRRPAYVKVGLCGDLGEVHRQASPAWLTRFLSLRQATLVQALSDEIAAELRSIDVAPERIVPLPNGTELLRRTAASAGKHESRRRLDLPERDTIVLFVGRFARYKGIDDLLAVWRASRWRAATLVLVGGPSPNQPVHLIENEPGIVVRGWTPDVVEYLRAADVFVYPSYADGMSNALLEAMALGVPPVASRSGSAEDMIHDGSDGLLIDAGDHEQLRSALQRVLEDTALRRRLGEGARASAARYSIDEVAVRLESYYRSMLSA